MHIEDPPKKQKIKRPQNYALFARKQNFLVNMHFYRKSCLKAIFMAFMEVHPKCT